MSKPAKPRPRFYRGDLDDQVTTAANGARANRSYTEFVTAGPWGTVATQQVTPRIHSITGYGIANHTFIESATGLIMIDTGQNVGSALEALKMKDAFSSKPIVAVIYTHHHYTRGTRAIIDRYPDREIPVFAHPDVDANLQALFSYLAPGRFQRGFVQFGHALPAEGPDAAYGIEEPSFEDPQLNAAGHVPVSHPVADGEEVTVDGLRIVFHHAVGDTEDSLIIHVPELDLVVHNTAVMGFMFPMYTLRGELNRSPPEVLASIDKLRSIKAKHLIGCHGYPVSGRDQVYAYATAHRDALAYVYQQTVRGINQGFAPEEIARNVRLPEQLATLPELFPAYVDVEHMVRGIYRGLVGWFANDTADLHPPSAEELGAEIVQGFGGAEALVQRAQAVLQEKRYNLAAKLAAFVLADDPTHSDARQIKADALRKMAQATPTGIQTRNFMLHEALQLESQVDVFDPREHGKIPLPVDAVAAFPSAATLEILSYSIDGEAAANLRAVAGLEVTDSEEYFTLAIRHGAAEFSHGLAEEPELTISADKRGWAEMLAGTALLTDLVDQDRATLSGNDALKAEFLSAYHELF